MPRRKGRNYTVEFHMIPCYLKGLFICVDPCHLFTQIKQSTMTDLLEKPNYYIQVADE